MAEISFSGPVFDGTAEELLKEMAEKIQETLAGRALTQWEENMDEHFRDNGGVYTGYAQVKNDGPDVVVNDGWGDTNELPYGLWLEGVGSRNAPVTVFEGYHSLEDAYTTIESQVEEVSQVVVDAYVDLINNE